MIFGLHYLDVAVILAYLFLMAAVGIWVARRVKDTAHYFMGNRGFGKLLMIGQSFGVGTQMDQPVGTAGRAYKLGFSGLWFGWKYLFCTPFYWLIAPLFRRLRYITSAEYMETRYGRGMAILYGFYALLFMMINIAAMQNGAAKVVSQATNNALSHGTIVWSMTIVFIVYSYLGGLISSAVTDFLQSFLIVALSIMLVPFGIHKLGGFGEFRHALTQAQFSLSIPDGFTLSFVLVLSIQSLFSIFSQPHMMASVGTGKTENNCRVGFTYGNMLKRVCTIGWVLVGMIVIALAAQGKFAAPKDSEHAFGLACHYLLGPGFLGLMIASVLATNMSTCSAFMVDIGALFIQNLYKPYFRPGAPDKHYLWMGRAAGVVMSLAAMALISVLNSVMDAILNSDSLAAFMGVSFIGGLVWKRANRWGACASFIVGCGVYFYWIGHRFHTIDAWSSDIFIYSLGVSIATYVLGSLVTPPEPDEKWSDLQTRLHTPASVEDASDAERPDRARQAEANGEGLILVDLGKLHKTFTFQRYRNDIVGFLGALGVILALIGIAVLIAHA